MFAGGISIAVITNDKSNVTHQVLRCWCTLFSFHEKRAAVYRESDSDNRNQYKYVCTNQQLTRH